ncbi:hypothetical protein ACHAXT_004228 [Thalassiosira profunda]
MAAPPLTLRGSAAACVFLAAARLAASEAPEDAGPCQLYLAESTIPNAGLGVFAGTSFKENEMIGRVGDAAFPTVDHDWHNSPASGGLSKHEGDYHWPLTNYDWNAPDIGMDSEAEDVSVTVTGFGAAPNCHFRLLNVHEHEATYDNAGVDRYTDPGAGASTPWFNRSSTAVRDIEAGSELYVDYGPNWFLSREGIFELVPIKDSFEKAQAFLKEYGKLLVGSENPADLVEDKMSLDDEVQRDLWDVVKNFSYASRERQALPADHKDAMRAIHGDIQAIEKENSIRSVEYLEKHGKCQDNIMPKMSSIPHAGRGAFATRFIAKGGLVAPAPVVHIADKAAANMYNETIGIRGNIVRDEEHLMLKQIILNYCFGHPNSTLLLFPYSSNVAYINHHSTEYNAELRWATDFAFYHHEDWLSKPIEFLEEQWTSGLMLEFIALRDIQPGEEVLINYGDEWQRAWDEHVKNWKPISAESDYNNLTLWTDLSEHNNGKLGYVRADALNQDTDSALRTMEEQKAEPYPHNVEMKCQVNVNHETAYLFEPETIPYFTRDWEESLDDPPDADEKHLHFCNITERYETEEESGDSGEGKEDKKVEYVYTVEIEAKKETDGLEPIKERHTVMDVPRDAISFVDVHYTSDVFLKHAFRHEMKLPDAIFPKAWMNLIPKEERE